MDNGTVLLTCRYDYEPGVDADKKGEARTYYFVAYALRDDSLRVGEVYFCTETWSCAVPPTNLNQIKTEYTKSSVGTHNSMPAAVVLSHEARDEWEARVEREIESLEKVR
jgi:hypothetical protein